MGSAVEILKKSFEAANIRYVLYNREEDKEVKFEIITEKERVILLHVAETEMMDMGLSLRVYGVVKHLSEDSIFILKTINDFNNSYKFLKTVYQNGEIQIHLDVLVNNNNNAELLIWLSSMISAIESLINGIEFALVDEKSDNEEILKEMILVCWDKVLLRMKKAYSIDDVSYRTWLLPVKVSAIERSVLKLVVPEELSFAIPYLVTTYAAPIRETIKGLLHRALEVEFCIKNED